jgi:hypothetical protein
MTAITFLAGGLGGLAGLPGVAWPPGGHGSPVGLVLGAELALQGWLLVAVAKAAMAAPTAAAYSSSPGWASASAWPTTIAVTAKYMGLRTYR